MKKRPWTLLRILMLPVWLTLGAVGAILLFQRHALYLPPGPPAEGVGPVVVSRFDGTELHGWVVHPERPNALVVFGGNAMALSPMKDRLAACTERAVWLVPYRGYEGNPGKPSETPLIEDGKAVVLKAHEKHADVAILGISVGTGVAMGVAGGAKVSRIALITPFDRLSAVVHDHVSVLPEWLVLDRFDSTRHARHVPFPVSILQADRDEIVDDARTQGIIRAFPLPPIVTHVPTTHNGVWDRPEWCAWLRESVDTPASVIPAK